MVKRNTVAIVVSVVFVFAGCAKEGAQPTAPASASAPAKVSSYQEEIDAWHAGRVERLKADGGWLSVVGLEWIEEGENSLGSDPSSKVRLPEGKAPARAGSIFLEKGRLRIEAAPDSGIRFKGNPVTTMELLPDTSEGTTELTLGTLTFFPISRGDRLALRVRDTEAETRKTFTAIERYPVDEKWRIEGRWVPYDPPRETMIANIIGIEEPAKIIGAVEFEIEGRTFRLEPLADSLDQDLFLIFADATSGTETYGAGRYVYSKPPDQNGKVIIDFNKAYNPPCVFTNFATCPLPSPQNRLDIPITAGEKMYGDHDFTLKE